MFLPICLKGTSVCSDIEVAKCTNYAWKRGEREGEGEREREREREGGREGERERGVTYNKPSNP